MAEDECWSSLRERWLYISQSCAKQTALFVPQPRGVGTQGADVNEARGRGIHLSSVQADYCGNRPGTGFNGDSTLPNSCAGSADDVYSYAEIACAVQALSATLEHIAESNLEEHPVPRHPCVERAVEKATHEQPLMHIGLYLPPSAEYVMSLLACISAGVVFVPLDTSWPARRCRAVLDAADLVAIVCSAQTAELARAWLPSSGAEARPTQLVGSRSYCSSCENYPSPSGEVKSLPKKSDYPALTPASQQHEALQHATPVRSVTCSSPAKGPSVEINLLTAEIDHLPLALQDEALQQHATSVRPPIMIELSQSYITQAVKRSSQQLARGGRGAPGCGDLQGDEQAAEGRGGAGSGAGAGAGGEGGEPEGERDPSSRASAGSGGHSHGCGCGYGYVLFTSGSTGRPRGVLGTLPGLLSRLRWMHQLYPPQPGEVACFKSATAFVDHLTELLSPLLGGCPVLIPPLGVVRTHPPDLLAYLEAYGVSRLVATPSLLRVLLPALLHPARPPADDSWRGSTSPKPERRARLRLRLLTVSGEQLHAGLLRQLHAALPLGCAVLNLYGSTETSGDCTWHDTDPLLPSLEPHEHERQLDWWPVPIGQALPGNWVGVLDPRTMLPVGEGEVGEICVAGVGVAAGYLKDTSMTAQRFVPIPEHLAAEIDRACQQRHHKVCGLRLFRTGDYGKRLPGGSLLLVGRVDEQVKVRGHRVELGEVESALLSHPDVLSAAAKLWWRSQGGCLAPADCHLAAYVQLRATPVILGPAVAPGQVNEEIRGTGTAGRPPTTVAPRDATLPLFNDTNSIPNTTVAVEDHRGGGEEEAERMQAGAETGGGTAPHNAVAGAGGSRGDTCQRSSVWELEGSSADVAQQQWSPPGASLRGAQLKEWLRGILPAPAVPAHVAVLERMPRTASGKPDRLALPPPPLGQLAANGMGEHDGAVGRSPPGSRLLHVIAHVMGRAVAAERALAPGVDFFHSGGTSVSAAQVAFELGIPLALVYQHPTPQALQVALLCLRKEGKQEEVEGEEEERWHQEPLPFWGADNSSKQHHLCHSQICRAGNGGSGIVGDSNRDGDRGRDGDIGANRDTDGDGDRDNGNRDRGRDGDGDWGAEGAGMISGSSRRRSRSSAPRAQPMARQSRIREELAWPEAEPTSVAEGPEVAEVAEVPRKCGQAEGGGHSAGKAATVQRDGDKHMSIKRLLPSLPPKELEPGTGTGPGPGPEPELERSKWGGDGASKRARVLPPEAGDAESYGSGELEEQEEVEEEAPSGRHLRCGSAAAGLHGRLDDCTGCAPAVNSSVTAGGAEASLFSECGRLPPPPDSNATVNVTRCDHVCVLNGGWRREVAAAAPAAAAAAAVAGAVGQGQGQGPGQEGVGQEEEDHPGGAEWRRRLQGGDGISPSLSEPQPLQGQQQQPEEQEQLEEEDEQEKQEQRQEQCRQQDEQEQDYKQQRRQEQQQAEEQEQEHEEEKEAEDVMRRGEALQVVWRARLGSCVDASPLLVGHGATWRCIVGSHARNVACINMRGEIEWETHVGGRVESTPALTADASQVVVGCYGPHDGAICFLALHDGALTWKLPIAGQVKCQPVVDTWRGHVWCGAHDGHLHVLNPSARQARWRHPCGGSVFAPALLDQERRRVYVATTGGSLIAIAARGGLREVWRRDVRAPVFSGLALHAGSGHVVVATVAGMVAALSPEGSPLWQVRVGGPVFGGLCGPRDLPGQVLLAARDGCVYSLCLLCGAPQWTYDAGGPITAGPCSNMTAVGRLGCHVMADGELKALKMRQNCRGGGVAARAAGGVIVAACTAGGIVHLLRSPPPALLACRCAASGQSEPPGTSWKGTLRLQSPRIDSSRGVVPESASWGARCAIPWAPGATLATQGSGAAGTPGAAQALPVATLRLPGDAFSSPVMIDGILFVGCRDDHLYCLRSPA